MKKKVRSTRRGSLWKFNVNTAPITCDQWFVYPELIFPPMKDSCDSLTGFGSLLLIFFWADMTIVDVLNGHTFGFYFEGGKQSRRILLSLVLWLNNCEFFIHSVDWLPVGLLRFHIGSLFFFHLFIFFSFFFFFFSF